MGGTALSCDIKSYKLCSCCCTTAYMVSNHYYSKLLKNFEEGAFLLDKNYYQAYLYAIDQYWHNVQRIDNWYIPCPSKCKRIAKQRKSYSNIENKIVDYLD